MAMTMTTLISMFLTHLGCSLAPSCLLCYRQTDSEPILSPQQLPVSGVLGTDLPPDIQAAPAKSGEQDLEKGGLVV